ncbi:MAG: hypothetical protein EOS03_32380 [Mesorhizobium sp.]|nr:MAG: hypothetical protein EOS03_32380 [Mesorhizobium sp.]
MSAKFLVDVGRRRAIRRKIEPGLPADRVIGEARSVISLLEGEMSPKATEGSPRMERQLLLSAHKMSHPVEPTPSGLPAISPSRGEITHTPVHPTPASC